MAKVSQIGGRQGSRATFTLMTTTQGDASAVMDNWRRQSFLGCGKKVTVPSLAICNCAIMRLRELGGGGGIIMASLLNFTETPNLLEPVDAYRNDGFPSGLVDQNAGPAANGGTSMEALEVLQSDRKAISKLLDEAIAATATERDFIRRGPVFAQELPRAIRGALRDFVLDDSAPAILIKGNPFVDQPLPPTPSSHLTRRDTPLSRAELLAGMYTSLLGECVGFATQQGGRIFNNIIAVESQAHVANSSAGSDLTFDLHTEDAFHPCPPDYLTLSCLRNEEQAVTNLAWLPPGSLDRDVVTRLMRDAVTMSPNAMHVQGGATSAGRFPILSGDAGNPYLRLNLNTLGVGSEGVPHETRTAIDAFVDAVRRNTFPVALEPGDYLVLNNRRCLHGRGPIRADVHRRRPVVDTGCCRIRYPGLTSSSRQCRRAKCRCPRIRLRDRAPARANRHTRCPSDLGGMLRCSSR